MSAIGVYHLDTEGIPYSANILIGCICIIFNCEKKMQKKNLKTRFNTPYSRMTASGFKTRLSAQTTCVCISLCTNDSRKEGVIVS